MYKSVNFDQQSSSLLQKFGYKMYNLKYVYKCDLKWCGIKNLQKLLCYMCKKGRKPSNSTLEKLDIDEKILFSIFYQKSSIQIENH